MTAAAVLRWLSGTPLPWSRARRLIVRRPSHRPLWATPWYETRSLARAFGNQPLVKGVGWTEIITDDKYRRLARRCEAGGESQRLIVRRLSTRRGP